MKGWPSEALPVTSRGEQNTDERDELESSFKGCRLRGRRWLQITISCDLDKNCRIWINLMWESMEQSSGLFQLIHTNLIGFDLHSVLKHDRCSMWMSYQPRPFQQLLAYYLMLIGLISLYLLSEEGRCGVQRWEPEDLKFSETLLFLIRCSKLGQNFAKKCHLHALFL